MATQERGQEFRVMITGIVEYDDHSAPRRLLAQQSLEEVLKRYGVEDRAHHAYKLTGAQADGAEASHGLASRRMLQDGIFDFRRYPHAAARAMLLEVAFIQAPQFDVVAASQAMEFFLQPRLSADQIERLGAAACAAESPFVGTVADIAAHPGPPRSADADARTRPARPRAWQPNRSRAGSCADRPATDANPWPPASAVAPLARLPEVRLNHLFRSGSPSAVRSCRSRQTVRRPRGRIAQRSPVAIHAIDGRNATPRYARSPAEPLFALPRHPRSVVCASPFSQR